MSKTVFGTTSKGKCAYKYVIGNSKGIKVVLSDFGATVLELFVPDKNGQLRDVALGYDEVAPYEKETTFFGAIVGPYANRIAGAKTEIDGIEYQLDVNDNVNNLHSGYNTMAKNVWDVKEHTHNKIVFTYENPHLAQGLPGNMEVEVSYEINEDNQLVISYHGVSDRKTSFNMTNHTYFNLNGHTAGNTKNHELMIKASGYTPIDEVLIPTGEVVSVEGTPFDFRVEKPIGRDIEAVDEQLKLGAGYDHNFAIDKEVDGVEKVAEAYSPESGIAMEVLTDSIGIQLYTGNFIGGQKGKGGYVYENRDGFCLETQFFPNSINEPKFVRPIKEAGEAYETVTIYGFGVR